MNRIETNQVGYMGPDSAPFACRYCKHYQDRESGSGCDDKEVIHDLGKGKNGLAPVSPDGCCNEFKPRENNACCIGMKLVQIGRKQGDGIA